MTTIASTMPRTSGTLVRTPASARSRHDDARAVPAVVRSEWIKLSSVRTNRVILGLTVVGGLLFTIAVAKLKTDEVQYVADAGFYWTTITSVLAAIGGILLFTSEVQHGTLAASLTAQPTRWVVALAKAITAAAMGFVLGAVGIVVGFGGTLLGGLAAGNTSTIAATAFWALLFTTLSALFGLGIGMVLRHSTGAIAGLLVWGFVLENLLHAFATPAIARFFPFVAGNHMIAKNSGLDTAATLAVALSRAQNALVFGTYTALALLAGTILLYRRDTN